MEERAAKRIFPSTQQDYDIVTHLPFGVASARPLIAPRLIPAFLQKDYDIISNKKLYGSSASEEEAGRVALLKEATVKFNKKNRFDPIKQKYSDPIESERMRRWESAYHTADVLRQEGRLPTGTRNRDSALYNLLNNEIPVSADRRELSRRDRRALRKREREFNNFLMEKGWAIKDSNDDIINDNRKINRIDFARFDEELARGFDIVSNLDYFRRTFSHPTTHTVSLPHIKPKKNLWQRALEGLQQPTTVVQQDDILKDSETHHEDHISEQSSRMSSSRLSTQRSNLPSRRSNLSAKISARETARMSSSRSTMRNYLANVVSRAAEGTTN